MEQRAIVLTNLIMSRALPSHDIELDTGEVTWAVNREVDDLSIGDEVVVVPTSSMRGYYILRRSFD